MATLSAFLVFAACSEQGDSQEEATSGDAQQEQQTAPQEQAADDFDISQDEDGPKPELSFEKSTHDFGQVKEGEVVTHHFKFTNTGEKPLVIAQAKPSCGCTTPKYPKDPIAPGESADIEVGYDSKNRPGKFKKSIRIVSNTVPNQTTLYIEGEVTP